ncbi:MAG: hypothetical protein IJL56_03035 [Bacteroidales bacterium]|nr:hypothetical protein [Bacteroidales bacterium]
MRRFTTLAAILMTTALVFSPSALAQQTRRGGSSSSRATTSSTSRGSTSTSVRSSSGSTSRVSSGSSSRSVSYNAPSYSRQGTTTRQSTTTSRQSGSTSRATQSGSTSRATQSGSTSRQSGTVTQSGSTTRQSTTTSRQSGTTSRATQSGTTSRQSGTATQSGSTTRQSTTTSRQSGSTSRATQSGSTSRATQSGTTVRSSGTTSRATGTATQSATTGSRQNSTVSRATQSGTTVRSSGGTLRENSNVTRQGLTGGAVSNNTDTRQPMDNYRDRGGNYRYNDHEFMLDDHHDLHRVPPRSRGFLSYDRPYHFFADHPHYYGFRVNYIPPRYRRIHHWGIDYYLYNGIYYRLFGNVYVVCRPPFGTIIDRAIDRAIFNSVRFSYYCSDYWTYRTVFDNYETIAAQNRIIAQNNAAIARQNASYALNSTRALSAYEIANNLGLVQSYAYANSNYFYQDGVFYIEQNGQYTVIIPPAGALVTSLPEDYETIVMNGVEYYLVDNTVYRTMLFESQPYLEVLGQMYGDLYNKYNPYR